MLAIEAKGIVKKYSKKTILDDFSLNIEQGSIFGILGPNGAGKTTFVKSILDLIPISKGEILINGVKHHLPAARTRLSYLPEKFSFYPFYTVKNVLNFYASMKGLSGKIAKDEIEKALIELNIKGQENQKVKTLSKGQLQRVGIGCVVIGNPQVLILDEPFSGLDPIGIKDIKTVINNISAKGSTVLINSHILAEIEKITNEVAILDNGKCLAKGNLKELAKGNNLEDFFYKVIKESGEAV